MRRVTLCRTSRRGYDGIIVVSCCYHNLLCNNSVAASLAMRAGSQACLGTGGCLSRIDNHVGVIIGIDLGHRLCDLVIATRAVRAFGQAGRGTSGSNGRVGHHVVSECINNGLRNENLVTCRAVLALSQTGRGTGRGISLISHLGVSRGGDRLGLGRATGRTGVSLYAVRSTRRCGGFYTCIPAVAGCGNDPRICSNFHSACFIAEIQATIRARPILGIAISCARVSRGYMMFGNCMSTQQNIATVTISVRIGVFMNTGRINIIVTVGESTRTGVLGVALRNTCGRYNSVGNLMRCRVPSVMSVIIGGFFRNSGSSGIRGIDSRSILQGSRIYSYFYKSNRCICLSSLIGNGFCARSTYNNCTAIRTADTCSGRRCIQISGAGIKRTAYRDFRTVHSWTSFGCAKRSPNVSKRRYVTCCIHKLFSTPLSDIINKNIHTGRQSYLCATRNNHFTARQKRHVL